MHRSVLPAGSPVRQGNRWVWPTGESVPVVAGGDGPLRANSVDAMVRRLEDELEERSSFIAGLAAGAQDQGRDLNSTEMELIGSARERCTQLQDQLTPLREASRIAIESRAAVRETDQAISSGRRRGILGDIEYRSAGAYIADMYHGRMGDRDAQERLEVFHRAAAHQTTADNPGLLPERIVEPVINGVDEGRPLVSAIGPTDLGPGSYAYARVTQHTQVGKQSGGEKTELPSRKMTITKTPINGDTFGGYVNVSRQDIRRTSPGILDMIISDLAGQYAIETEDEAAAVLVAAATAGTVNIPATPTALGISMAVWGAVGQSAALLRAANIPARGPILAVSPDRMGIIGPLFPAVNPQNAITQGFQAVELAQQGVQGAPLSGLTVVMGVGLPAETTLLIFRSAVRCFEDRYGSMQVDEPSVWGTQVGYAGDFECVVLNAGGVIAIGQD